jgi:hypothetical protein
MFLSAYVSVCDGPLYVISRRHRPVAGRCAGILRHISSTSTLLGSLINQET